jgi:GMP synthase-like glutamine amidotransferase
MSAALILQHGDWGPPGLLADWAHARGVPVRVHRVDRGEPYPELDGHAFVASLGSKWSPADTDVPDVRLELEFVDRVVARGIPVLGLCYGGQVLAKVLGAEIEHAPEPELGWHSFRSSAPDVISEGPWLTWHYERFTLPPGAEQLATSPICVQAFRHGRHLGVQFHPESTMEIVRGWARLDHERLASLGIEDGETLIDQGRGHAHAASAAAAALFDAFWRRAQESERRVP